MAVHTFGWCRVEGAHVPDLGKRYGIFQNLPSTTMVFYGTIEVEIYHPTDTLNGIVYKEVPVSELCNLNTINEIDEHFQELRDAITSYDKTIDMTSGSQYWYEPFAVSVPTVIFYASTNNDGVYRNYTLLLADENAAPPIIAISAEYGGPSIPVGTHFAKKDINVHAIYDDGQESLVTDNDFTIIPDDAVIHQEGSNVVTVLYTTPEGQDLSTSCIVVGVKNVESITARYDTGAPMLADGQTVERKYVIVTALFTDGSSSTVTDYQFVNGQVAHLAPGTGSNRSTPLTVYYKGKTTTFTVQMYEVKSARLVAYYNGPDVEVGSKYLLDYVTVKIYYNGDPGVGGYQKNVDINKCEFSQDTILERGVNTIQVSTISEKMGPVSTSMSIMGIQSEVSVSFITAEYSGPEIYVNKSYSFDKVTVVVHYSDGSAIETHNWSTTTNIVSQVGINSFQITYREKGVDYLASISVIGIENESTTETGYSPVTLDLNYPEAITMNNRYRGPAEAAKRRHFARALYDNLNNINSIFKNIEENYKEVCAMIEESSGAKYSSLLTVEKMEAGCSSWRNDDRFTSGNYIYKE